MSKDKEKCQCGCGEDLDENTCHCSGDCDCGEDCHCTEEDKCNPNCTCGEECSCDHECHCEENKDYLKDLLRVQAEFDNYRKRMTTALGDARQDGFMDAITQFLPAIDSFKMATEYITDQNTLMGIKFIEKGILDTLSKMGVEAIDASGKFDPTLHQAIDTDTTADIESGMIVKEAYKGFTYKGKVIRYSQVIVKK
ncbi:MAG: nucleotide exchange factor GrpE [Clostridiales bacterium]|nr:nucleotide exchange factor GrpE [Clostridiales bacterium]